MAAHDLLDFGAELDDDVPGRLQSGSAFILCGPVVFGSSLCHLVSTFLGDASMGRARHLLRFGVRILGQKADPLVQIRNLL